MNPLHPQVVRAHKELLQELFVLERRGSFDQALAELRGVWDNVSEPPNVHGLDPRQSAETYLRCGALLGFLGHTRQIPTAQEASRNLLTSARSMFLGIYEPEKIAECENYLALAYWRTGEINEAASWIDEARSHDISDTSQTRLYSVVIQNLLFLTQKKFDEICSISIDLEELFLRNADSFLLGNFYMNFGIAAKNLGDVDHSLDALEKARDFFARSGNKIQIAMADNNLSQLHKAARRFDRAHAAIDRATDLFREISDRTREGFSLDTKALIYFDEGKFEAALETVDQALSILGKSENYGYLTETIATKARIQLFLNDFSTATLTLIEAVDIAKLRISEEAATNLVREFEQALNKRTSYEPPSEPEPSGLASGEFKLSLPPSISHYKEYHGVWLSNSDLEPYGLARGHLAVVVPCSVRRGDLVAIIELENDLVSCGFYDSDFGIVCLETGDTEPQLFDRSDIKILGRIVGVCDAKGNSNKTLEVQALSL